MVAQCGKRTLRLWLLLVIIGFLVLQNVDQSQGMKKKMIKKLKKMLPLLLAIKPKKKLVILPLPFPMMMKGGKFGGFGGGGGSGGGMSWGGSGMMEMPPIGMNYMSGGLMMPAMPAMDNGWMMMTSMDCSKDFYGMGGGSSHGGSSKQTYGGSGGYSGGSGGGWSDGSGNTESFKENFSGSGDYQQGNSHHQGGGGSYNNIQRPVSNGGWA